MMTSTSPTSVLNFGAYYLDQQPDAFDGAVHAALAAYNAGPGNAARWYKIAGDDLDLFKETMDFPETRKYIDRIYLGQAVYRFFVWAVGADWRVGEY
ncbi:MAG: transglycosylase SLT domain-containing protein [Chloroflexi bacterium]|nr:transglycosylase SLT domain-containing protein [Chloroflexota bacterium]